MRQESQRLAQNGADAPLQPYCEPDAHGRCLTCSDEMLQVRVIELGPLLALAQVELEGQLIEVDITLVDEVAIGHILLIHGGVAMANLKENDETE